MNGWDEYVDEHPGRALKGTAKSYPRVKRVPCVCQGSYGWGGGGSGQLRAQLRAPCLNIFVGFFYPDEHVQTDRVAPLKTAIYHVVHFNANTSRVRAPCHARFTFP